MVTETDCYLGKNCRGPKYHVCLSGKEDTFPELLGEVRRKKSPAKVWRSKGAGSRSSNQSPAQLANLKLGNERWVAKREADKERNERIISIYKSGHVSTVQIAKDFKLGRDTVLRVLREAQADGLLTIRKPGHTLANGAV